MRFYRAIYDRDDETVEVIIPATDRRDAYGRALGATPDGARLRGVVHLRGRAGARP